MVKGLSNLGEFGIIDVFEQKNNQPRDWVVAGMGDDCAVLDLGGNTCLVVTTDMLAEGTHFEWRWISAYQLGYKSVAVNLSDVAAMGADPWAYFLSMGLSKDWNESNLLGFRDGIFDCAAQYGMDLLGGDTVAIQDRTVLSLTLLGRAPKNQIVYRSGAKPGDGILVGGCLGDSAGGLYLLQKGSGGIGGEEYENLTNTHLKPVAQVELGRMLAVNRLANAMIDISDGLVQDVGHICQQSRVGAVLDAEQIPLSRSLRTLGRSTGLDPLDFALQGGEDYVLCFCVPPDLVGRTIHLSRTQLQIEVTQVGEIVAGSGVKVRRGDGWHSVAQRGFNHFR